jgi:hypothetical protein
MSLCIGEAQDREALIEAAAILQQLAGMEMVGEPNQQNETAVAN